MQINPHEYARAIEAGDNMARENHRLSQRIAVLEEFVREHDAWLSLQNNANYQAMMKARAAVGEVGP